jgi:hypothetical protein
MLNSVFWVVTPCSRVDRKSEFQKHVLYASLGYKKGCSAMKIGASVSFEMLVYMCLVTQHHVAEHHKLQSDCFAVFTLL